MRKTIILLLLLYAATTVMAQNNNDSISFTNITTTDFMEAIGGGKISWSTMAKPKPKRIKCPKDVNDNCGGGFWNAIGNFFAGIGGAIWNGIRWAGITLASMFDGDGGGAGGNWSLNPPHATWGNYNGGGTPPNFVPPGGSGGGGSATTNNTNPLGNTTIPPPVKPVVDDEITKEEDSSIIKKDTLQPVKIDCPTNEVNRGKLLTKILDSLNNKPQTQQIKDSLTSWKNEAGYSIDWDTANKDYKPKYYATGDTNNVEITIYDSSCIIIGGLHTHPKGKDGYAPGPSPKDLFQLAEAFIYNPNFKHSFVLGADGTEWALSTNSNTNNTATIQQFLANFPPDSLLSGNEWSNKYLPNMKDGLYDFWFRFSKILNQVYNYPLEKSQTYANIILMKYVFNTGVDLYIKGDDGKMHKLDILLDKDTNNNLIIQVQICN